MNYEKFKEELMQEILKRAGEGYKAQLQTIRKNNGIDKEAVSVCRENGKIAPLIYLEGLYEKYRQGCSVEMAAEIVMNSFREMNRALPKIDPAFFSAYENAKEHIYCRLVSRCMNEALLKEIPYYPYLDLAIVYYYMSDKIAKGEATVQICETHRKHWGISKEELHRQAWKNTVTKLQAELRPIGEILREFLPEMEPKNVSLKNKVPEKAEEETEKAEEGTIKAEDELAEAFLTEIENESNLQMYVLTNQKKSYGAITIRYPGMLQRISHKLGGDYFILPSSVHECILVPAKGEIRMEMLLGMVQEINRTQVEPQEVLSDQVYYYDDILENIVFEDTKMQEPKALSDPVLRKEESYQMKNKTETEEN